MFGQFLFRGDIVRRYGADSWKLYIVDNSYQMVDEETGHWYCAIRRPSAAKDSEPEVERMDYLELVLREEPPQQTVSAASPIETKPLDLVFR